MPLITSRLSGRTSTRGCSTTAGTRCRERTFAHQKELGVIPGDAELTARPPEIPSWDDMPDDLKPVLARQMEVYAGFMEHTDHHVGRLIAALEELEIMDDTLVYVIVGDNGASAEGTPQGCFNELIVLNGAAGWRPPSSWHRSIDKFGTPEAYNHYAVGWAHAMDTPYQWTKQIASHWGGTRNGTIVRWKNGIRANGEIRNQFHHVIDVAPTILEAAGLPAPLFVNGIQQAPLEGVSMAYSFDDADAEDRHTTQYFEMFVNRGIYHEGWTAVTRHSIPWVMADMPALDDDVWELYGPDDWTQSRNLAAEQPERLAHLQRQFLIEAGKYNVLPLDDRRIERFSSDTSRSTAAHPRQHPDPLWWDGPPVRELGAGGQEQVACHHGRRSRYPRGCRRHDRGPGWRLRWMEPLPDDRRTPAYCYNLFGVQPLQTYGSDPMHRGRAPGQDRVHL